MKRVLSLAALLFLPACSDSPMQAPLDVQPQFINIGDGDTWSFQGTVTAVFGGSGAIGDYVEGTVTWTITSDDIEPDDPCVGVQETTTSFTYTLGGQDYTLTAPGVAVALAACNPFGPTVEINATDFSDPDNVVAWRLALSNPGGTEDFPLAMPALGLDPHFFQSSEVLVNLTEPPSGPQTKDDCKNGGWADYGFKNQGQCVRFIETGKDSRP